MQVTGLSSETFWKGESEIRGTVTDDGETYRVSILLRRDQVYEYSCTRIRAGKPAGHCSCSTTVSAGNPTMCRHASAVLDAYLHREKEQDLKPVSTSQKVRFMVREYTNREVSKMMEAGEEGQVRLVPRLFFERDRVRAVFFVGQKKLYPVKDLVIFSQAVEFERVLEYGKKFSFHHGISSFTPESRPLLMYLVELVGLYREHYRLLRRGQLETQPVLKELVLGSSSLSRFFDILEGQTIECEDYRKNVRNLTFKKQNPPMTIHVRKAGKDGVCVSVEKELISITDGRKLFIADMDSLYCCDEEYTEALSLFMNYLVSSPDAEYQVLVNDRDMPLFCERVLKRLDLLKMVKTEDVDLESYRPEELKASFYFDSPKADTITLTPTLSYGEISFHPLEDEKLPKEVCRDVPGEFKVSRLLTRYFKVSAENEKELLIHDDEEAMYRLLSEGMKQFMELGEVYLSDSFRKLKVLPPSRVSVQIRTSGSWLTLEVDSGGLSKEELGAVLREYGKKKKFFRMRSGEFLTLGDGGLLTVAKLSEELDLSKELVNTGMMKIPKYRASLLDQIFKEDRSITVYRDQLFKEVVRGMKDVEDSDYEVPASLTEVLRSYQKVGFCWLRTLDTYGFGGILADEMGLGKTIQVIALLLDEKEKKPDGPPSLIVCPASLIYNWESEFHTFAPQIRTLVVAGSQAEREALFETEGFAEAGTHDVYITSYDLLKRDLVHYLERQFRFEIIDEAQYIKNASTKAARAVKAITAVTKFALTGTPIENHLLELWSIFDYLMPGFLFTASRFRQNFELPIMRDEDGLILEKLHRFTGPFILRRLKKDVLKELPDKLETVLYSVMDHEQKNVYRTAAALLKEQLSDKDDKDLGTERFQILSELMRLRQICCDPSLCFDKYKGGSAKLDTCLELLTNAVSGGHKVLLFSQFTSMLELIAGRLKKEGLEFYMLTGSTPKKERMQMVTSFQKDDVSIFLISLKAGGTGLNLTAADIVIHYDPWWNAAAENQATDRAHRIGQEKQVTVFKLIMRNTIEENIMKLQEQKKQLSDHVIREGGGAFSSLSRADLIQMLDDHD